jgi:hypothetical protein
LCRNVLNLQFVEEAKEVPQYPHSVVQDFLLKHKQIVILFGTQKFLPTAI